MNERGDILAIIEPENHPQTVVDRAVWLAGVSGCDVQLLLCDQDVGPLADGFLLSNEARDIGEKIRVAQKEMIAELAETAGQPGVSVSTDVLEQRPIGDGILHRSLNINPRYVVKGTQYHSAAKRSIFVDTDWQLIRSCPYPLWLVKPAEIRQQPVIVAAVDPTHSHDKPAALDQAIIDAAQDIATRTQGDVHLLHTYHRLTGIGAAATRTFKPIKLPIDELDEKIKAEHREKLDTLAAKNQIDAEHTHQLPGSARELLPTFVRSKKADLVVMGALARWGLKRAIIGSTAERVLDHLPCDILIVRSNNKD